MRTRSGSPVNVGIGFPVAIIGVDEMPDAAKRGVCERIAVAGGTCRVRALEDAHLIGEIPVRKLQDPADARRKIGGVRLEAARLQRLLEGLALPQEIADGIRLVAVRDDHVAADAADGRIDDEGRVLDLARVKRVDRDVLALFTKDAIAAVLAPPHDEIGEYGLLPVLALADDDAAADIAVAADQFPDIGNGINAHGYDLRS